MPSLEQVDWTGLTEALGERGFAMARNVLSARECRQVAAWFDRDDMFRSHIVMRRHGFGEGEYKYFDYPLPDLVAGLREAIYARLSPLANDWADKLRLPARYPSELSELTALCHRSGQRRPTPLLLQYGPGDYNRLHQDLYGELSFPLQVAVLLDRPGQDFTGGQFVLTEQKPRSQSRVQVVDLARGDAVIFAVNDRPALGQRGYYRLKMRHGVSELLSGRRHTLGIIFHDAT